MSMILLPNDPAVHPVIPQEVLKQLTDQSVFSDLPFARLIIHLTTNKTEKCSIILNNSLISSPYKSPYINIESGKRLPPLDKPIGANRTDIWIPRAPLIRPPRPWHAPVIPVRGAPPPRPTQAEFDARPVPIAPTTSMYVYPLKNPEQIPAAPPAANAAATTRRREQAEQEEKDVLKHWDFLKKQIEYKLHNIFFGNKEGTGEEWKKVLLKLPSPSQPSNTAVSKLYKLSLKPTFKGKGVHNWRVDPNISAHPITSPKPPPAGQQSYFDQLNNVALLPNPLPIPDEGINPYSTVKPYKFFIYPTPRRFLYTSHQALPNRPYWPPLCNIVPQPGAPINVAHLPPWATPPIGLAVNPPLIIPAAVAPAPPNPHQGKASLLTAYDDMELHINIKLKLEVEEIKLEGRDIDSEIRKLKKIPIKETGKDIHSKTQAFCGDVMKKSKSLVEEKYGPGSKKFKRAANLRKRNFDRDLQRDIGTPAEGTTLNRGTTAFNRGMWICGGRKKRRKGTRRKKNRKKSTRKKRKKKNRKKGTRKKKNRKKGTMKK